MSDISKRLRPESTDLSGSDVLVDILSRLPVKSLRRFQCASKSWHALISHSHFVKKHLSLINNTTNSFKLLFETRPLQSLDYQALLKYLKEDDGAPIAPTELDYPVMTPNSRLLIFGSCNGLICLQFDKTDIVLWNPCTGESNLLPQATIFDGVHDCGSIFYGFGYDSKAEDYKVMRGGFKGEYASDGYSWRLETIIEVFSLKNGSWRSTQVSDMDLAIEGQGCLVNDTLHWVDDDNHAAIIMRFDLAEEKFNETVLCLCTIQTDSENFIGGVLNIRNCAAVYSSNSDDFGILSDSGTSKKEYKIWVIDHYSPAIMTFDSPSKRSTKEPNLIPSQSSMDYFSSSSLKYPVGKDEVAALRTVENSPQAFSASSRPGSSRGPFTSTKSEYSWGFFNSYAGYPNYMANTESSRAKVRSQSAPRQRLEFEKYGLTKKSVQEFCEAGTCSETGLAQDADFRNKAFRSSSHFNRLR